MKRLIAVAWVFCATIISAGNFIEIPTEEKLKDKDLTFALTFDKRSVNADFAKGNPVSTTMKDVGLLLRGSVGFDTMQAFQPVAGEDLKFETIGNVSPHSGTLVMWVNALDYDPGTEKTNDQSRGNIALAQMWFQQGQRNINYQLYEFADNVYFDWWSSEPPHGWGQYGRVQASCKGIKKNEWRQIAVTWTDQKISLYLNGNLVRDAALPVKSSKTADLEPEKEKSFLGIKSRFYDDNHKWGVVVDDVKIYSRVMAPLEIKNQYVRLLKDQSAVKIQDYDITLNGVNTGHSDKLDKLEAEFDFTVLPKALAEDLKNGKLVVDYKLTSPDKKDRSGKWTFSKNSECRILDGVEQVGTYTLETSINGKSNVVTSINRPDLSFAHNGIGDKDEVPAIWKDFAVNGRNITLWNRIYKFGDGPLPISITVNGAELLDAAPQLVIDSAQISYKAGKTERTNRSVTFTGTGQATGFSIDYSTTVEFDGMIKFDWTLKGAPDIKSMSLDWQVKPEFCQFLMTPFLQEKKGPQFSFTYPACDWDPSQLWLVTEKKGGFAYSMPNDANWVYDPAKPVFFANTATGKCSVTMVDKAIKMPENTPYEALFIATPTRPLPAKNRIIRFGDSTRGDTPHLGMTAGDGLTGVFTFEPHKTDFEYRMKNAIPNTVSVYGGANSLTDASDVANYFKKYWNIPLASIYKMGYQRPVGEGKYETDYPLTVPACNAGIINDYYLYNEKKLLEHPYGDRVWQIYYDLCGNDLCANPAHGCLFQDKFGRSIKTFSLLNKRELIKRTVSLAHQNNRTVMLHAQRFFTPFMHGLADYYFPGEQHNTLLIRNPFGYTDELSDKLYRSEYNRDVLGVGVIFLPALGQASMANFAEPAYPYTEGMLTMLLSHDIESSQDWAAGPPFIKTWNALEKYGVQSPKTKCHLYYEQQTVTSSSPDVRVTWYECPDSQFVLIITNKDIGSRSTEIDVGKIAKGSFDAYEEYIGTDIKVVDGKFTIKVPSRSFRIVCFPPKAFYPVTDAFSNRWGSWKEPDSDTEFSLDLKAGHDKPPALLMKRGGKGGGCFLNRFPVKQGKTYTASVWVKQENAKDASLTFQGQNVAGFIGETPITASSPAVEGWRKLELKFKVPSTGKWAECTYLMVNFGASEANSTTWFDDFTMSEE